MFGIVQGKPANEVFTIHSSTISCCCRFGMALLILCGGEALPADRSPAKKIRPAPASEIPLEALSQKAKKSVVVISHFDRDGKEDGVGAGFVVASNGLIATSLHVIGEGRPIKV